MKCSILRGIEGERPDQSRPSGALRIPDGDEPEQILGDRCHLGPRENMTVTPRSDIVGSREAPKRPIVNTVPTGLPSNARTAVVFDSREHPTRAVPPQPRQRTYRLGADGSRGDQRDIQSFARPCRVRNRMQLHTDPGTCLAFHGLDTMVSPGPVPYSRCRWLWQDGFDTLSGRAGS